MEDRGWRTSFNHSILYPLIPYPLFSILDLLSSILHSPRPRFPRDLHGYRAPPTRTRMPALKFSR
jgi:hypothetical protein